MKILIALDYNPTAQKVAESAYALGIETNSQMVLLHVLAEPIQYATSGYSSIMGFGGYIDLEMLPSFGNEQLIQSSQEYLEATKKFLGNDTIQTLVKEGNVAETILEIASQINADLIVMGSHSKGWLEQKLIGSQTENVLHHTPIPLLIIPTKGAN